MPIVLRPMTEDTYQIYMREHEEEHARDRMITDRESYEDALRITRAQHAALLPQGLKTPEQYFFLVEDKISARLVGYLWFAYRPANQELYLYHVLIKEAARRQGYGRSAMEALDEKARELGCRAIWLNVMAHNQGAIDFYRAQGYRVGAVHMSKHCERD
jgi:ribosomal protein S18 acetylase RimI-like enzyme